MIGTVMTLTLIMLFTLLAVEVVLLYKEAQADNELEKTEEALLEMLSTIAARQYEIDRRLNRLQEKIDADDDIR